jgi:hypothetical protein
MKLAGLNSEIVVKSADAVDSLIGDGWMGFPFTF